MIRVLIILGMIWVRVVLVAFLVIHQTKKKKEKSVTIDKDEGFGALN